MKRLFLTTLLAGTALFVAACDDSSKKRADKPLDFKPETITNAEGKLAEAIRQKPVLGGKIVARPTTLYLEIDRGGTAAQGTRLTNEGDVPVVIQSLITTTQQRGLTLGGACAAKPTATIQPGEYCDLDVSYTDATGRSLDSSILITSDAKLAPQVSVAVQVDVREEKVKLPDMPGAPPAPDAPGNNAPAPQNPQTPGTPMPPIPGAQPSRPLPPKPRAAIDPAYAAALQDARAKRMTGGFGRAAAQDQGFGNLRPQTVSKTNDPRYDPDTLPWTESSLPVDRSRILTVDRVIKAVLETPVTNVMCNQVVAVVESHVYSPDSVNVLIPAGTKAIGRCQAFADERANIQWERLITPSGVSIRFNQLMGDTGDASGRGGVPGRVEQSVFGRYVAPVISTTIDTLGAVARALYGSTKTTTFDPLTGRETTTQTAKDQAIDDFNNTARNGIKQVIQDIAETRKVVVIPGGTRIDIILQEDVYFKTPYEVVRLADVEYDLRKPVRPPVMLEQPAPGFALQPQLSDAPGRRDAKTVTIDGRTYTLQPAPSSLPPGVRSGSQDPYYAQPQLPAYQPGLGPRQNPQILPAPAPRNGRATVPASPQVPQAYYDDINALDPGSAPTGAVVDAPVRQTPRVAQPQIYSQRPR